MTSFRSRVSAALLVGTVAVLASAAPSSAAGKQTVRCVGTADFCGATVNVAGGARDRVVTVRLTDTSFALAQVSGVQTVTDGYAITRKSFRLGGSEIRFTLNAKKTNPKRARVVLLFAATDAPTAPAAPGASLQGGTKSATAIFSVGAGMTVSIVGGGDGTSICTTDETVTTFVTKGNDEEHPFGYYAKGSGGCAFQLSWSQFKVTVKDAKGTLVGSGRMFFGQQFVDGNYAVSCDYAPWVGTGCSAPGGLDGGRLKIAR